MFLERKKNISDYIGTVTSSLCLVHCMAIPFLFLFQTFIDFNINALINNKTIFFYWEVLDYVFLIIAFGAVYHSTKRMEKIIKYLMWAMWACLSIGIFFEKLGVHKAIYLMYLSSLSLIILHTYGLILWKYRRNKIKF